MFSIRLRLRSLFIAIIRSSPIKAALKLAVHLSHLLSEKDSHSSIKQLDLVLNQAKSLADFLSDTKLQDEYYSLLKIYFSSKNVSRSFPRKSYNAIIDQMKILAQKVPNFSQAAWNKKIIGRKFAITVKEQDCGRKLNPLLWRIYRYEWVDTLRVQSHSLKIKDINSILLGTLKRIRSFEEDLKIAKTRGYEAFGIQKSNRKTPKILRNAFYENLVKDEQLRAAGAKLLHQYLMRPQNQIFFELIDANLVLHFLNELRQNPRKTLLYSFHAPIPNAFLSVIKNLIPDPLQLLADKTLFQEERPLPFQGAHPLIRRDRLSEYVTFPVRPFHSLWSGIFGKDCLGGDHAHLDKLCAARWAVSLLNGTQTDFVERRGKYQGFLRTVQLNHPLVEKTLRNIEIWVPAMNRSAIEISTDRHQITSHVPLFEHWFKHWLNANKHLDTPLLMSDSRIIDNERVKEIMFSSLAYTQGKILPMPHLLSPSDSLIEEINEVLPPLPAARAYFHGSIVLDVTLKDALKVRILNTENMGQAIKYEILNPVCVSHESISQANMETMNTRTKA